MTATGTAENQSSSAVGAAAVAAAVTAAAAITYHVVSTRRLRTRLTEQRLAERQGRIRAEVKLRTLMKGPAANGGAATSIQNGPGVGDGRHDMNLRCIGTIVSPFTKRMGTPRQGSLAPHSRGYVQLNVPVQTVEGMELYSHAWVIFSFHANTDLPDSAKTKIRPPRAPKGTKVGMLATRSPHRPNAIGLSLVRVVGVDSKSRRLHIAALDLVNGTPVYDIKPCVPWDIPGHHDTEDLSVPDWVSQDDAMQTVDFEPNARDALRRLVEEGKFAPLYTTLNDGTNGAAQTLCEVLAQDPRASHTRGSVQTSHPYRLVFSSAAVDFIVKEAGVLVVDIKPVDFDETKRVDGVPLASEGGVMTVEKS